MGTTSAEGVVADAIFELRVFRDLLTEEEHMALVYGEVANVSDVWVRVHSECATGNTLNSLRCDCGAQYSASLHMMVQHGAGVMLYVTGHEGRGIGLTNQCRSRQLLTARLIKRPKQ